MNPEDSDLRTALARASCNSKRQTHSLVREAVTSVQLKKKMLVVGLKGLVAKTN
jgi:hypothetical protein